MHSSKGLRAWTQHKKGRLRWEERFVVFNLLEMHVDSDCWRISRDESSMPQSIAKFIAATGVVDVHEHHIPEILLGREVNLLQLFQQSYAGWTQARPY